MLHNEKCCECQQMTDGTAQYVRNYHDCFVPERWGLEYPSLDHPGREWSFYLLGHCQYLGVWDTLWYYLVLPCTSSDSYSLAEAF